MEQEKLEEELAKPIDKDIRKIYIKNYGNLALEMVGTNEIGVSAYSEKRKEELFIPWTSIIMISKIEGEPMDIVTKARHDEHTKD